MSAELSSAELSAEQKIHNLVDGLAADILVVRNVDALSGFTLALVDAWRESLRAERDRCAAECERLAKQWAFADQALYDEQRDNRDDGARSCADAIRALEVTE